MKVILIGGQKRAGKDYSAKVLQEMLAEQGYTSKTLSFAAPLKEIAANTLNISLETLDDRKNNYDQLTTDGMDYREFLQRLGTEGLRNTFGDDIFVRYTQNEIYKYMDDEIDFVIIPDFRFFDEYRGMLLFDIVTLKIETNIENTDTHASETGLVDFKFDYIIDNSAKNPDILRDYLQSFIEIKLSQN